MKRNKIKMLAACAAVVVAAIAADAAPLKFMTFNVWGDYFGNPGL